MVRSYLEEIKGIKLGTNHIDIHGESMDSDLIDLVETNFGVEVDNTKKKH